VEFTSTESIFFATLFVLAGIACLARLISGNEHIGYRVVCGRCLSSGFLAVGVVGIWLGRNTDPGSVSPVYWVAVAIFVGLFTKDMQDRIIEKAFTLFVKRLFGEEDKTS
jgi:hypothetical protein